jgi:hypothetical protein
MAVQTNSYNENRYEQHALDEHTVHEKKKKYFDVNASHTQKKSDVSLYSEFSLAG